MPASQEPEGSDVGLVDGLSWAGLTAMASFFVVVLMGGVILAWGLGDRNDDGAGADRIRRAEQAGQESAGQADRESRDDPAAPSRSPSAEGSEWES